MDSPRAGTLGYPERCIVSNLKNGHRERRLKSEFKSRCRAANLPCWLCRQPISYDAPAGSSRSFEADHIKPVSTHPHLGYVMSNLAPSCCACNRSRGSRPVPVGEWIVADW
ncbi:HNH endonuclease signature motif containing protein [Mycolicibacterium sp.]|uniref:HNH endonuclease signature motif containing protein n=1 Tax=Mycolicibacterium sp. TaxID=2320850 RepID=UPI001A22BDEB|nr:HNH endonuclease signature motif containing protein [Mycolicibacterium sp.]MBJ7401597.1 HNH endonuclease [Mycolicibacterium sp.]